MLLMMMMVTSYLLTDDSDTNFTQLDDFATMLRLPLPTKLKKNLQCLFLIVFHLIKNTLPILFLMHLIHKTLIFICGGVFSLRISYFTLELSQQMTVMGESC